MIRRTFLQIALSVFMSAHHVDCMSFTQIAGRNNTRVKELFSLRCTVDVYAAYIFIDDPQSNRVSCRPPGLSPATCSDTDFTANGTEKTVTLEKYASLNDDGIWKCIYNSPTPISISNRVTVIQLDNIFELQQNIVLHSTALNGSKIDKTSNDTFTVIFGCISKTVTIEWKLTSSSLFWITEATISNTSKYSCNDTNTQLYSYTVSAPEVLAYLKSGTSTLVARVYYSGEELGYSTFNVTFDAGPYGGGSCDLCALLVLLWPIDVAVFILLLLRRMKQLDSVQVKEMQKKPCQKWILTKLLLETIVYLVIKCLQAAIEMAVLIARFKLPVDYVIGISIPMIPVSTAINMLIFWSVIWCLCHRRNAVNRVDSEITKESSRKSSNGDAGLRSPVTPGRKLPPLPPLTRTDLPPLIQTDPDKIVTTDKKKKKKKKTTKTEVNEEDQAETKKSEINDQVDAENLPETIKISD